MNEKLPNVDWRFGALRVAYREYAPDEFMPPHAHAYASISFVIRGAAEEIAGRSRRLASAGFAALKPAGFEHSDRVGTNGLAILSIRWNTPHAWPALSSELIKPREWMGGGELVLGMKRLAALVCGTRKVDSTTRECVEQAVLDVGGALCDSARDSGQWIEGVREHIHTSFDCPMSLVDAARAVNRHPVSVARAFRRRFGCSVVEYAHRLRIERAMQNLADRDASLADVALSVGYADQAHFSRFFRRMTGRTPGQYRHLTCAREVLS